jgi:hypothetical protein
MAGLGMMAPECGCRARCGWSSCAHQGYGEEFLREAVQVKNIWVPFGV